MITPDSPDPHAPGVAADAPEARAAHVRQGASPSPALSSRAIGTIARPEAIAVALLLMVVAAGAALVPPFRDAAYLLDTTSLYMEIGVMALAMTFVIIAGEIDLSVASALALSGAIAARLYADAHVPMAIVVLLTPLIGALLGLFNGLLVTRLGLPSLTVTLGTLALYRGLAQVLHGDHSIGGFPEWFNGIDERKIGLIPLPLILFTVLAIITGVVLHRTTFGRTVYAVGTNQAAARFSGLRVDRAKLLVFALSGLMSGVGAVMILSRLRVARYDHAPGWELAVITAVVLGGTDIFGGTGSIFGTAVALFLLGIISRAMGLERITAEKQMAVTGTLLIVAVVLVNLTGRFGSRGRR
jgi:rhamnose transport system permease protein